MSRILADAATSGKLPAWSEVVDQISVRIRAQPLRSVGAALLLGAWLGYERPHRGIVMGLLRMLAMSELAQFVDALPAKYSEVLRHPLATVAARPGTSAPRAVPS